MYKRQKLYRGVLDDLSVRDVEGNKLVMLNGTRIVVPTAARQGVVRELHKSHSGITKTFLTAQQLYYWPGMRSDIKSFIEACIPCQESRPSQRARNYWRPPHLLKPGNP